MICGEGSLKKMWWKVMTCSCSKGYEGTAADTWSIAVCLVELLCGLGTVESASATEGSSRDARKVGSTSTK